MIGSKNLFLAAILLALFFNAVLASRSRKLAATPTWKPVGALKQTTIQKGGYARDPVIANVPDGTLYVAYLTQVILEPGTFPDFSKGSTNFHIYKHDPKSKSWTSLPNPPLRNRNSWDVELAVDSKGVLYMGLGSSTDGYISVYKFEDGKWTVLQEKFPNSGNRSHPGLFSMAVDSDDTLYITSILNPDRGIGKLSLFKYDAAAKEFKVVGKEGFTPGIARYSQIAFNKNQPYVSFLLEDNFTVSVMTFVDNEWRSVGDSIGLSKREATWNNIAINDKGVIYVGYGLVQDEKTGAAGVNFEVQKYENGAWSAVGEPNVAPRNSGYGAMAMNPATSTPWIVIVPYDANDNQAPATAWKFSGGKWVSEGSIGSNISYQSGLGITVSDTPCVLVSYKGPKIESNAGLATVYSLSK